MSAQMLRKKQTSSSRVDIDPMHSSASYFRLTLSTLAVHSDYITLGCDCQKILQKSYEKLRTKLCKTYEKLTTTLIRYLTKT